MLPELPAKTLLKWNSKMRATIYLLFVVSLLNGCADQGQYKRGRLFSIAHSALSSDAMISDKQAQAIHDRYFMPDCETMQKKVRERCRQEYAGYSSKNSSYLNPEFLKQVDSPVAPHDSQSLRNDMIDQLILLSDHNFSEYMIYLTATSSTFESGADIASTLLSTTATIATGGATPRILSGVSAFITGTRATIDRNFLANQSIPILINTMNASRSTMKTDILKGKLKPIAEYSIDTAASDVQAMDRQGNLVVALSSLLGKTGKDAADAQVGLDNEKRK
jgi:hypothetical protein